MSAADLHNAGSNPFSTRFTRPGALPYRFDGDMTIDELVRRFEAAGRRGQIVGPHGSGKSTLLSELVPALAAAGHPAFVFALHDGEQRLPDGWQRRVREAGAHTVVIDGFEQLSRVASIEVSAFCRFLGWGQLVTVHESFGLPTLLTTRSTRQVARDLAAELLRGNPVQLSEQDVDEAFDAAGGNVRETLFRLYDRWELARRSGKSGAGPEAR